MPHRLSKRYALKLLEFARVTGEVERVGKELDALREVIDPELARLMDHPAFEGRTTFLEKLMERLGFSLALGALLDELAGRRQLRLLREISERYSRLADEHLGRVRVRVRSALPLEGSLRALVEERVRAHWGSNVVLSWEVDPELLGGVVIEGKGERVDASLRGGLERLLREATQEET